MNSQPLARGPSRRLMLSRGAAAVGAGTASLLLPRIARAQSGKIGTYLFALPGSTGACKDAWDQILVFQLDSRHLPCNFRPGRLKARPGSSSRPPNLTPRRCPSPACACATSTPPSVSSPPCWR